MLTHSDPNRHWGCRINDKITWQNMNAIILQNEQIQIVILIDKGAEIIQFLYKPMDVDFLWRAPNSITTPDHFVRAGSSQNSQFFDHWDGGWIEILPNGGTACEYKGAPLGFYAETINVPWNCRILEDTPEKVSISLWVKLARLPLTLQKTLTLITGTPALFIEEVVVNDGTETIEFMWGHHPVVGPPFLNDSCRISAPDCIVEVFNDEDGPDYRMGLFQKGRWPTIKDRDGNPMDLRLVPPPSSRSMDNCYLYGFNEGWIAITNTNLKVGFGLAWDPTVFRYIWLWQALGGGIGFPWYGRTYNIGIEPWSSYPCSGLNAAIGNGTALSLNAGESMRSWLTAVAYSQKEDVKNISRTGLVE